MIKKNKYYSSNRNKSNDKHNNHSNSNIFVVSMLSPGACIMDVADGVFILANGVTQASWPRSSKAMVLSSSPPTSRWRVRCWHLRAMALAVGQKHTGRLANHPR